MGWNLKCMPCFDNMEFYEFLTKYEKLKEKIKKEKGNKTIDFLENFRNMMPTKG